MAATPGHRGEVGAVVAVGLGAGRGGLGGALGGRVVRGGGRVDGYAVPHPQAEAHANVNLSEYFKKQK